MSSIDTFKTEPPKSFLFIGNPGTGKTTFMLQFSDVFILDCDQNLNGPVRYLRSVNKLGTNIELGNPFLDAKGNPTPRELRFDRSVELMNEAAASGKYKYLFIDSATSFLEFVFDKTRKLQGRKIADGLTKADDPLQLQDWGVVLGLLKRVVFDYRQHNLTFGLSAHVEVDKDELTNVLYNFIAIPGKMRYILSGWFEEVYRFTAEASGQGSTAVTKRKIETVADSRSLNLGLKSALGLPANLIAEHKTVADKIASTI